LPQHELLFLSGSYLLGSIPFGFLIVYFKQKKDVRTMGSGSTGATNVLRSQGKAAALATVVLDIAKGTVPVLYGLRHFDSPVLVLAGGAAAILGHIFPIFLRFRGGKGVATLAGVFLAFHLPSIIVLIVFFCGGIIWTRYVSVGSLIAVSALFFSVLFTHTAEISALTLAIVLVIIARHSANIRRLLAGKENRFSLKKRG